MADLMDSGNAERIELSADSQKLVTAVENAVEAWLKYGRTLDSIVDITQKTVKGADETIIKFTEMSKSGHEFIRTAKLMEDGFLDTGITLKNLSTSLDGYKESLDSLPKTLGISIDADRVTPNSLQKYQEALGTVQTMVQAHGYSIKGIAAYWSEIASGKGFTSYTAKNAEGYLATINLYEATKHISDEYGKIEQHNKEEARLIKAATDAERERLTVRKQIRTETEASAQRVAGFNAILQGRTLPLEGKLDTKDQVKFSQLAETVRQDVIAGITKLDDVERAFQEAAEGKVTVLGEGLDKSEMHLAKLTEAWRTYKKVTAEPTTVVANETQNASAIEKTNKVIKDRIAAYDAMLARQIAKAPVREATDKENVAWAKAATAVREDVLKGSITLEQVELALQEAIGGKVFDVTKSLSMQEVKVISLANAYKEYIKASTAPVTDPAILAKMSVVSDVRKTKDTTATTLPTTIADVVKMNTAWESFTQLVMKSNVEAAQLKDIVAGIANNNLDAVLKGMPEGATELAKRLIQIDEIYADINVQAEKLAEKNATAAFRTKTLSNITLGSPLGPEASIGIEKQLDAVLRLKDAQGITTENLATYTEGLKKNDTAVIADIRSHTGLLEAMVKLNKEEERYNAERQRATTVADYKTFLKGTPTTKVGWTDIERQSTAQVFVQRYDKAEENLRNFVLKHNFSADEIRRIWTKLEQGIKKAEIDPVSAKAEQHLIAFRKELVNVGKEAPAVGRSVKNILDGWEIALRFAALNLARRGMYTLIQQLHGGINATIELEKKIGEIQTIDQTKMPFERWRDSLKVLSNEFGLAIIDEVEGAYQTLSNQVAQGADAFLFMAAANKFAITTQGSVADSVDLLSTVINAYGMNVAAAEDISAKFFKIIDLGRVRMSEMANIMGQSVVPTSQLGISMEEYGAAIAMMTQKGVKFTTASTYMRNIVMSMLKPSVEMTKFYRSVGVESGEAAIAAFGFGGVLAKLEEYTRGSSTELKQLFLNIRSTTGAMMFAGKGLDKYESYLSQINNANADYIQANIIVLQTAGKKLEVELNKIRNFFNVEAGDELLRLLNETTNGFKNFEDSVRGAAEVIMVSLIPASLVATNAMVGLLAATGKTIIILGAAVTAASVLAERYWLSEWRAQTKAKRIMEEWEVSNSKVTKALLEDYEKLIQQTNKMVDQRARALSKDTANSIQAITRQESFQEDAFARSITNQKIYFGQFKKELDKVISNFDKEDQRLRSKASDLQKSLETLVTGVSETSFDWSLELGNTDEANVRKRLALINDRIKAYVKTVQEASVELDTKTMEAANKEILNLVKQRESLLAKDHQEKIKDEKELEKLMRERMKLAREFRDEEATVKTKEDKIVLEKKYSDELQKINKEVQAINIKERITFDIQRDGLSIIKQVRDATIAAHRRIEEEDKRIQNEKIRRQTILNQLDEKNAALSDFKLKDVETMTKETEVLDFFAKRRTAILELMALERSANVSSVRGTRNLSVLQDLLYQGQRTQVQKLAVLKLQEAQRLRERADAEAKEGVENIRKQLTDRIAQREEAKTAIKGLLVNLQVDADPIYNKFRSMSFKGLVEDGKLAQFNDVIRGLPVALDNLLRDIENKEDISKVIESAQGAFNTISGILNIKPTLVSGIPATAKVDEFFNSLGALQRLIAGNDKSLINNYDAIIQLDAALKASTGKVDALSTVMATDVEVTKDNTKSVRELTAALDALILNKLSKEEIEKTLQKEVEKAATVPMKEVPAAKELPPSAEPIKPLELDLTKEAAKAAGVTDLVPSPTAVKIEPPIEPILTTPDADFKNLLDEYVSKSPTAEDETKRIIEVLKSPSTAVDRDKAINELQIQQMRERAARKYSDEEEKQLLEREQIFNEIRAKESEITPPQASIKTEEGFFTGILYDTLDVLAKVADSFVPSASASEFATPRFQEAFGSETLLGPKEEPTQSLLVKGLKDLFAQQIESWRLTALALSLGPNKFMLGIKEPVASALNASWLTAYDKKMIEVAENAKGEINEGQQLALAITESVSALPPMLSLLQILIAKLGLGGLAAFNAYEASPSGSYNEVAKSAASGFLMQAGMAPAKYLPKLLGMMYSGTLFGSIASAGGGDLNDYVASTVTGAGLAGVGRPGPTVANLQKMLAEQFPVEKQGDQYILRFLESAKKSKMDELQVNFSRYKLTPEQQAIVDHYQAKLPPNFPEIRIVDNFTGEPRVEGQYHPDTNRSAVTLSSYDDIDFFKYKVAHEAAHPLLRDLESQYLTSAPTKFTPYLNKMFKANDSGTPITGYIERVFAKLANNEITILEALGEILADSYAVNEVGGETLAKARANNPEAMDAFEPIYQNMNKLPPPTYYAQPIRTLTEAWKDNIGKFGPTEISTLKPAYDLLRNIKNPDELAKNTERLDELTARIKNIYDYFATTDLETAAIKNPNLTHSETLKAAEVARAQIAEAVVGIRPTNRAEATAREALFELLQRRPVRLQSARYALQELQDYIYPKESWQRFVTEQPFIPSPVVDVTGKKQLSSDYLYNVGQNNLPFNMMTVDFMRSISLETAKNVDKWIKSLIKQGVPEDKIRVTGIPKELIEEKYIDRSGMLTDVRNLTTTLPPPLKATVDQGIKTKEESIELQPKYVFGRGRSLYGMLDYFKQQGEVTYNQETLESALTTWLLENGPKPPEPTVQLRGSRNKEDIVSPYYYTHTTPFVNVANIGGGGQSADFVKAYPYLPEQLWYRGGALGGIPLEETQLHNVKGKTWEEGLAETKELFDHLNDGTSNPQTLIHKLMRDFMYGMFEGDALNRAGIWKQYPIPEEWNPDSPHGDVSSISDWAFNQKLDNHETVLPKYILDKGGNVTDLSLFANKDALSKQLGELILQSKKDDEIIYNNLLSYFKNYKTVSMIKEKVTQGTVSVNETGVYDEDHLYTLKAGKNLEDTLDSGLQEHIFLAPGSQIKAILESFKKEYAQSNLEMPDYKIVQVPKEAAKETRPEVFKWGGDSYTLPYLLNNIKQEKLSPIIDVTTKSPSTLSNEYLYHVGDAEKTESIIYGDLLQEAALETKDAIKDWINYLIEVQDVLPTDIKVWGIKKSEIKSGKYYDREGVEHQVAPTQVEPPLGLLDTVTDMVASAVQAGSDLLLGGSASAAETTIFKNPVTSIQDITTEIIKEQKEVPTPTTDATLQRFQEDMAEYNNSLDAALDNIPTPASVPETLKTSITEMITEIIKEQQEVKTPDLTETTQALSTVYDESTQNELIERLVTQFPDMTDEIVEAILGIPESIDVTKVTNDNTTTQITILTPTDNRQAIDNIWGGLQAEGLVPPDKKQKKDKFGNLIPRKPTAEDIRDSLVTRRENNFRIMTDMNDLWNENGGPNGPGLSVLDKNADPNKTRAVKDIEKETKNKLKNLELEARKNRQNALRMGKKSTGWDTGMLLERDKILGEGEDAMNKVLGQGEFAAQLRPAPVPKEITNMDKNLGIIAEKVDRLAAVAAGD